MATTEEVREYMPKIRRIKALRYLDDLELRSLLAIAEVVAYDKGAKIVTQGKTGNHFYAVIKGAADVSISELQDGDIVISSLLEGDTFGEAAMFLKEERTASVTATQDCIMMSIARKNLMNYFKSNSNAGVKILLIIVFGLLTKLSNANQELAFEKQGDLDFDYVDTLVQDFMEEI
ncbi:MAG: cyclic nucleotide-binding domain-containing protein [Desulfobacterales bacterium]|nr:cyclic nucleotide-binding domain-containing protein [Desulfobacterales bacterium]